MVTEPKMFTRQMFDRIRGGHSQDISMVLSCGEVRPGVPGVFHGRRRTHVAIGSREDVREERCKSDDQCGQSDRGVDEAGARWPRRFAGWPLVL